MHANKPSATALLIAHSQLIFANDFPFSQLITPQKKIYYIRFSGFDKKKSLIKLLYRYWLKFIELCSIRGLYVHYALRKYYIEQIIKNSLDQKKVEQVVSIAAGFDPILTILATEYTNITFFELDHIATQQVKVSALNDLSINTRLTLIPIDLTKERIDEVLSQNNLFSSNKSTLFIAEGITMYLTSKEIESFFTCIHNCTNSTNSYFLFSYMNKQLSGSIQFSSARKIVDYWLYLKKETFKWGISTEDLDDFLLSLNYQLIDIYDSNDLYDQYITKNHLKNMQIARGENLCLAVMK